MSHFVGKWKLDPKTSQNYDAFAAASGMTPEMIKMFREAESTLEYKIDGDFWTVIFSASYMPEPRTYRVQLGKLLETTDHMNKGVKVLINLKDGKLVEKSESEMLGWKTMNSTREVKGKELIMTMELDGVTMSQVWRRCD